MIAVSTMELAMRGDGETDAIDGDRALHGHVAVEFGRNADAQPPVVAFGREARHAAHSIHVTLYKMSAQFFAGGEWTLEVQSLPGPHLAKGSEAEGFQGKVGGEGFSGDLNNGKAAAIHGDACRGDGKSDAARRAEREHGYARPRRAGGFDGLELSYVLNNSGKHRTGLLRGQMIAR